MIKEENRRFFIFFSVRFSFEVYYDVSPLAYKNNDCYFVTSSDVYNNTYVIFSSVHKQSNLRKSQHIFFRYLLLDTVGAFCFCCIFAHSIRSYVFLLIPYVVYVLISVSWEFKKTFQSAVIILANAYLVKLHKLCSVLFTEVKSSYEIK